MNHASQCPECGARLALSGFCARCALALNATLPADDLGLPQAEESGAGALAVRYFGLYELLGIVGQGGMGVVYRARQINTGRLVALKLLKADCLGSSEAVERFHAEVKAAARLDHPHILPLYEVGEHKGQHYYTMKLVEEGSLAERISKHAGPMADDVPGHGRSPFEVRLPALVIAQVARAVHHAHQRGLLHRDLKPGNILIDQDHHPYVADFGLAKFLGEDTGLTRTEVVLGSPQYMSPEQARGQNRQVTVSSDVFSLGVILYECLTGAKPFAAETALETLRRVAGDEPIPPAHLNSAVDADLETICLKCLAKEPPARYLTAEALAEDLERWQRREPIHARPVSAWERSVKWVRRHPLRSGLIATAVFSLLLGVAGVTWQWRRAERALTDARALARLSELKLSHEYFSQGRSFEAWPMLARLVRADPADHAASWMLLNSLNERNVCLPVCAPWQHAGGVNRIAFSPDGRFIASSGNDGTARLVDARTGQVVLPPWRHPGAVRAVAFHPQTTALATACADGAARVWELPSGRLTFEVKHAGPVNDVTFSPDGERLATASEDHTVRISDARNGAGLMELAEGINSGVREVAFSPDGTRLLSLSKAARIWEVATGRCLAFIFHGGWLTSAVFSPRDNCVLTASYDGTARLWNAHTGQAQGEPLRHLSLVTQAGFSPDGSQIVTASKDTEVILWNVHSGTTPLRGISHAIKINAARFSPEAARLATASDDSTARLWDARTRTSLCEPLHHQAPVLDVRFSPDGRRLATFCADGVVTLWNLGERQAGPCHFTSRISTGLNEVPTPWAVFDPRGDQVIVTLPEGWVERRDACGGTLLSSNRLDASALRLAWFSDDARLLFALTAQGKAFLWDTRRNTRRDVPLTLTGEIERVTFDRPGRFLAVAANSGAAQVSDTQTGQALGAVVWSPMEGFPAYLKAPTVEFCADGDSLILGGLNGSVGVWSFAASNQPPRELYRHAARIRCCRLSPDGKILATGSADRTVRLADFPSGIRRCAPLQHEGELSQLAFSRDSRYLVSACEDGVARVWEARTGRLVSSTLRQNSVVLQAEFSPDSRRFSTLAWQGEARVWDVETGLPLNSIPLHDWQIHWSQFSPDGQQLLACTVETGVRVWSALAPGGRAPAWLADLGEAVAGMRLNAQRRFEPVPANQLVALRQTLATNSASDPWSAWGRWFFADRRTRAIAPNSALTVPE